MSLWRASLEGPRALEVPVSGLWQLVPLAPVALAALWFAWHEVRVVHPRHREVTKGLGPAFKHDGGRKR